MRKWVVLGMLLGSSILSPRTPAAPGEERAAYLGRAERLIRDPHYRAAIGGGYRVRTDDPRLDVRAAVRLLESFRSFFEAYWEGKVDLLEAEAESELFLFYSGFKLRQLRSFGGSPLEPSSFDFYDPALDVGALHTDAEQFDAVADTLLHLAGHQLVEQRLRRPGSRPSRWLTRGLAHYFAHTYRNRSAEFREGRVGGKSASLLDKTSGDRGRMTERRLRQLIREIVSVGSGDGSLFHRLLSDELLPAPLGEDARAEGDLGWALAHYLLHGKNGRHRDGFLRYVRLDLEGKGGADALARETGLDASALEKETLSHMKRLRARPLFRWGFDQSVTRPTDGDTP